MVGDRVCGRRRMRIRLGILCMCLLIPILLLLTGCEDECEVTVLDWPKSIKDCITAAEEKGLRDKTKDADDVWEDLVDRCPDVKNDDNGASLYNLRANPKAILVGSKKELAEKLTKYAKDNDCCIKKITFMGHGRPGQISVGDGQKKEECKYINGHPGNEADWKRDLAPLKKILCKDATFVLKGCGVGYCSIGLYKMQELAEEFGVTVIAPTVKTKGGQGIDDLDEDDVRRVTPPVGEKAKPDAKCNEAWESGARDEAESEAEAGLGVPFTDAVVALGFYAASDEDVPSIQDMPELPITDPEWIALFTEQIDPSRAYDATGEEYESEAIIVIQYAGVALDTDVGAYSYDYAHTAYGHGVFARITDEGRDLMFALSERGREMVEQGIELMQAGGL